MKFRTFRNVIAMVLFLGLGGTCYGCYAWWHNNLAQEEIARRMTEEEARKASMILEAKRARESAEQARLAAANPVLSPTTIASPGQHWQQATGLRPVDTDALTALARPVVDKIKDAAKGKPWKINVYADDGQRFNRLKVDLDRDEKEDETWTIFADGHIERKVSSKDNGTFDGTFRLEMTGWQDMTAGPSATTATAVPPTTTTTATAAAATATDGLRPVDKDMLALVGRVAVQEKVKDATKGKTWKINLYSDDGARFNRAKIDLDRDDKWDESWTWKSDGIERQVAPADDEKYSEVYRLNGESWTRKQP